MLGTFLAQFDTPKTQGSYQLPGPSGVMKCDNCHTSKISKKGSTLKTQDSTRLNEPSDLIKISKNFSDLEVTLKAKGSNRLPDPSARIKHERYHTSKISKNFSAKGLTLKTRPKEATKPNQLSDMIKYERIHTSKMSNYLASSELTLKTRGTSQHTNLPDVMEDPTSLLPTELLSLPTERSNLEARGRSQFLDPPNLIHDQNSLSPRMFTKGRLLGKGGFAMVFLVTEVEGGAKFADKVINTSLFSIKSKAREKVENEIYIHQKMSHDNVVKFCSFFEDQDFMHLLLEFCPKTTLFHVSQNRRQLTEEEVRYYVIQILEGVRYIHDQEVLHRDLKLSNMFLSAKMRVKIGDFGLAIAFKDNHEGGHCGTPNYFAPEVVDKQGHSVSSEVWAIGCMVFALLAGSPPFETKSKTHTYALIEKVDYTLPVGLSDEACSFVKVMLVKDPLERWRISPGWPTSLTSHPFIVTGFTPPSLPSSALKHVPLSLIMGRKSLHSDLLVHQRVKHLAPPETLSRTRFLDQVVRGIVACLDRPVEEEGLSLDLVPVFVSKWVYFSQDFGFGYKLTDGRVGVRFNDFTNISTLVDKVDVVYSDMKGEVYLFPRQEVDKEYPELKKKVALLGYFEEYMKEKLSESFMVRKSSIPHYSVSGQLTKVPQLERWSSSEDYVSMELGGELVQVNHMVDHVKLVLWVHQGKMLVSLVKQGKVQTYHLSGHCPFYLRRRLHPVLQELKRLANISHRTG